MLKIGAIILLQKTGKVRKGNIARECLTKTVGFAFAEANLCPLYSVFIFNGPSFSTRIHNLQYEPRIPG